MHGGRKRRPRSIRCRTEVCALHASYLLTPKLGSILISRPIAPKWSKPLEQLFQDVPAKEMEKVWMKHVYSAAMVHPG